MVVVIAQIVLSAGKLLPHILNILLTTPNTFQVLVRRQLRYTDFFFALPFDTSAILRAGGKLCFSLSALSESFRTSVYKNRLHRTLNLICWVFRLRLIRADEASLRLQISMNCLISETSVGIVSGVYEEGVRSLSLRR